MPGIEVPVFKQPRDSVLCGPTCAKMVLAYYGVNVSLKRIAGSMPMIKTGVHLSAIGTFFINNGFETLLKFWEPSLKPCWFGVEDSDASRGILRSKLFNKTTIKNYRFRLLQYLDAGGKLVFSPVMASDISDELRARRPMIININNMLCGSFGGRSNRGHYIVPVHISDNDSQTSRLMMGYLDPGYGECRFRYVEEVMFYNHIWEGGGLFIRSVR